MIGEPLQFSMPMVSSRVANISAAWNMKEPAAWPRLWSSASSSVGSNPVHLNYSWIQCRKDLWHWHSARNNNLCKHKGRLVGMHYSSPTMSIQEIVKEQLVSHYIRIARKQESRSRTRVSWYGYQSIQVNNTNDWQSIFTYERISYQFLLGQTSLAEELHWSRAFFLTFFWCAVGLSQAFFLI